MEGGFRTAFPFRSAISSINLVHSECLSKFFLSGQVFVVPSVFNSYIGLPCVSESRTALAVIMGWTTHGSLILTGS